MKFASTTPSTVPLISHAPTSPLLNVAVGATNVSASSQDTSAIAGTSIVGSGAGATSIVTTSSTELLSQPVAVSYTHLTRPTKA